jgi:hypothetical protein
MEDVKVGEDRETKEEKELRQLKKEKSSSIIGQSLPGMTALCLNKCVNIREH